jgi:hypothetical protein
VTRSVANADKSRWSPSLMSTPRCRVRRLTPNGRWFAGRRSLRPGMDDDPGSGRAHARVPDDAFLGELAFSAHGLKATRGSPTGRRFRWRSNSRGR